MHRNANVIVVLVVLLLPFQRVKGEKGAEDKSSPRATTANCYDSSNPHEVRLWEGSAPGASGDDPCRDIPFLHIYPADRSFRLFRRGHLASALALHSATDFKLPMHDAVDTMNGRPDFLGLGYPVISMIPTEFASPSSLSHLLHGYRSSELDGLEHYLSGQDNITPNTPPVFLFESMDDKQISAQNSVLFAQALQAAQIPADVHLFAHGVHGAGLAINIPEEETWPDLFHQWLVSQGFLKSQGNKQPLQKP